MLGQRSAWRWMLVCLWLALLPLPGLSAGAEPPPASIQLPATARAFTAPSGHTAVWLTLGPAPELWLAAWDGPPRLVLSGESEHFSAPVWSPDGLRVAVLAVPTGTETAALGRWLILDVTSQTVTVDSVPAWADAPPGTPSFQPPISNLQPPASNLQPPTSIRVAHHPSNSCRDLPDWAVTVVPFEEYVARVLPAEVYTSWSAAALRAQAIAIRTYAWRRMLLASPGAAYDISDWAVDQVMCDARYPATDAATAGTAGRYLASAGQIILAQYSAENGHPTVDGGLPYLKPVLDPVSLGRAQRGHGHGLSQWGAQRWASQRGWNTTQILAHYYTGAQVIDPFGGDPSLTLLTPWPGAWLTGSAAYLTAHASYPPTATVTVTFTAPGVQSAAVFGTLPGRWSADWPLPATLTRPVTITASAVATGAMPVTRTEVLILAGEDRMPPLGQFSLPASSASLTVTLYISATDAGGSGPAGVASGGNWQVGAADFTRQSGGGSLLTDAGALSGQAVALPAGAASLWGAMLPQPLATDQIYQAYARVRTAGTVPGTSEAPGTVARIELYDPAANTLLGFTDLRAGDFRQDGSYQEFPLDFWLSPQASGHLEIRLITAGAPVQESQPPTSKTSNLQSFVYFDRLRVLRGPAPFAEELPHRLEYRAGPQPVIVKLLDAAGNPSADILGVTQLADTTPPDNWRLLTPTGWVTATVRPVLSVAVADALSGVAPNGAAARFTTDGGVSWSAWQPVSTTVNLDGSAVLTWAWPGGEGNTGNRVQFRAADNAGLTATSPAWPVRVDVTPPSAALSVPRRAAVGVPFVVQWSGQDSGSGGAMFDMQVSSSSVPGTSEAPGTSSDIWRDWLSATSASQAIYLAQVSGALRFRVRAYDVAGNIGAWSSPQTTVVSGALVFLPLNR